MPAKKLPDKDAFDNAMRDLMDFIPYHYGVELRAKSPAPTNKDGSPLDYKLLEQAVNGRAVYWDGYAALKLIKRAEPVARKPRAAYGSRRTSQFPA